MNDTVALVVFFNHRFDANLEILRKLYGERFQYLRFLVPFYDGTDEDVIAVYENSYQFQGFWIQAHEKLMEIPCEYFMFIADDFILNPQFHQSNILQKLGMQGKEFLMDDCSAVNAPNMFSDWGHAKYFAKAFKSRGVNWQKELPDFNVAVQKYETFMKTRCELEYGKTFWGDATKGEVNSFVEQNNGVKIPYPLVMGYSDYFMIKKDKLYSFARICGIFASMNLFVEIAQPTAAMLIFERENVSMSKDRKPYRIELYWGNERLKLRDSYGKQLKNLYDAWSDDLLGIHPIKLSEWNV